MPFMQLLQPAAKNVVAILIKWIDDVILGPHVGEGIKSAAALIVTELVGDITHFSLHLSIALPVVSLFADRDFPFRSPMLIR